MAKPKGSGQARMRQYRSGRMVCCGDTGCLRHARMIGYSAEITWTCGKEPWAPKAKVTRWT